MTLRPLFNYIPYIAIDSGYFKRRAIYGCDEKNSVHFLSLSSTHRPSVLIHFKSDMGKITNYAKDRPLYFLSNRRVKHIIHYNVVLNSFKTRFLKFIPTAAAAIGTKL